MNTLQLERRLRRLEETIGIAEGTEPKEKKEKFVLYTNPNNTTSRAYVTIGNYEVNDLLRSSRQYPGSYDILYQGRGTSSDIEKIKQEFRNYRF